MAAGNKFRNRLKFWGFYFSVFTLFIICVVSMYKSFVENSGIDFTLFFSCTYAAMRGQDFFDVNNLVFYEWEEPLMVMPGLLLFFVPLLLFDIHVARLIYFMVGLGSTIFCYLWMFKLTGLLKKVDFRKPNLNAWMFLIGAFVILNSSPQLMCLRNGQMTTWVMLLLVLFFATNNRYCRTVFLGWPLFANIPCLHFLPHFCLLKNNTFSVLQLLAFFYWYLCGQLLQDTILLTFI